MRAVSGAGDSEPVLVERSGFVATVSFNRPPHNPLGLAVIDRLEAAFAELDGDPSVRAVILTGAGDRSFSVGADITEFGTAVATMGLKGFIDRARALAGELAEKAPLAVAGILKAVVQGGALSLRDGLALEFEALSRTSGTKDASEGITAFLEKRKPAFRGG
jgi:enoyl-CoA hydratase/carnithine racemase